MAHGHCLQCVGILFFARFSAPKLDAYSGFTTFLRLCFHPTLALRLTKGPSVLHACSVARDIALVMNCGCSSVVEHLLAKERSKFESLHPLVFVLSAPLAILSVLRDEASRLPEFFALLESLETSQILEGIHYSFYENDSADRTPDLLRCWLEGRRGNLISESFGERPHRSFSREVSRTVRLADARNKALEPLLKTACSWLLVIDADLAVRADQVISLLELAQANPTASMVCASAVQAVPDVLGDSPYSYYDSWALRDLDGNGGLTFLQNPLQRTMDRWRWMAGLPVSVQCAFGGMAILPMPLVRRVRPRWDGQHGCEHWAFCDAVRSHGPVLACPTVMPVALHPGGAPRWTEAYAQQVRQFIASRPQPGLAAAA